MFGPTLYAIAEAAANEDRTPRTNDNPTHDELGYDPMSLDDGLDLLIPWLRQLNHSTLDEASTPSPRPAWSCDAPGTCPLYLTQRRRMITVPAALETLDVERAGFYLRDDYFDLLDWLRANSPVHRSANGMWLVSRYDEIREISRDPARSAPATARSSTTRCAR